jgi:hypothetical protein
MGLSISVGLLAFLHREDPEVVEQLLADLEQVNRVLAAHGLPPHVEPESLPENAPDGFSFEDESIRRLWPAGMPYSHLHYLRRAVAFARQAPEEFCPIAAGVNPAEDDRIDHELSVCLDSHVICHSDGAGFYLPLDFPDPLYDDAEDDEESVAGDVIGSSPAAMRELTLTAPLLGVRLSDRILDDAEALAILQQRDHPCYIERLTWLRFFDRLLASVQLGSAVVFG